jgi:hypothetical protein
MLGGAQSLLQLFAHGCIRFQVRSGFEQVLPESVAFAHEALESPAQHSRLLFMLPGGFLGLLAGAINLDQPEWRSAVVWRSCSRLRSVWWAREAASSFARPSAHSASRLSTRERRRALSASRS